MNYLIDTMESFNQAANQAVNNCLAYFDNNKGNTKPNAANLNAIPYHIYENSWQWQISPSSTTSECLTLYLRALIACRQFDKAKNIADFILNFLLFDQVKLPHWLIDLAGNTEMETVRLGNYNSSVFNFNNGIAIIPNDVINNGHKVSHIRGCFTTDAKFPYPDYFLGNTTGDEKIIDQYIINQSGCTIYLQDTNFTGYLQVFYAYFNGQTLNQYDIYRTYPRNTKCIVNDEFDYQLSIATDAAQWAIIALKELAYALQDNSYSLKADEMLQTLISDMPVAQNFNRLFDATYRGLVWNSIGTYDESNIRYPFLDQIDKNHCRFHFGSDLNKRAVSWAVGKPFSWQSDSTLDITVSGNNFNALRQFVLKHNNKEFFYPWYDNFTGNKTYSLNKNDFVSLDNIILEPSRTPYLNPYTWHNDQGDCILTQKTYNSSWKDSDGLTYPLWYDLEYIFIDYYTQIIFGCGLPYNLPATNENSIISLILTGNTMQGCSLFFRMYDADNNMYINITPITITPEPQTFSFKIGDLLWVDMSGWPWDLKDQKTIPMKHPIKNIELLILWHWYEGWIPPHDHLYIASIYLENKLSFNSNSSDYLKFETRQSTSGYFDISKAILNEPINDKYHLAGVPVFTLEYTELGLMAWRSGSYSGYTNPLTYLHSPENYCVAIQFLKDAQDEFYKRFNIPGLFMPIYNRNLTENLIYDNLETWTFNGPDQNTTWMGFQYRTLINIAESYYQRLLYGDGIIDQTAKNILDKWVTFLQNWFKINSNLPSFVSSDGEILYTYQSADFIAQVGRAMLLKYLVDNDPIALNISQKMIIQLLNIQQQNGAFYPTGSNIYNFHQAEALLFLAQWINNFQSLSDIRRMVMDD